MKKKSKLPIIVVIIVIIVVIAAIGGDSSNKSKNELASEESSKGNVTEATYNKDKGASSKISIEEQLLVDKNGIKITATEYTNDSIWGEGIKLLIENNTDTTYTVGCDALIVNDYMITDLFASEIAPGKKANETMYLSSSALKAAGIDTVGKVEMYFHALDFSDITKPLFKNEFCEVKTSAFDNMDTTPNDAGIELYNNNGVKIVGKAVDEDSFWGTAILLYIENNSGINVGINVDEMSINGYMMNPLFSTTCYNGKKAINDITVFSSDLKDNNIEKIEEVELKFHIYDADSYQTITDSAPIKFASQ